MAAGHFDTMLWALSGLVLLPGSLADIALFREGAIGNLWPKWTLFAIPIAANALLFSVIAMVTRQTETTNTR